MGSHPHPKQKLTSLLLDQSQMWDKSSQAAQGLGVNSLNWLDLERTLSLTADLLCVVILLRDIGSEGAEY